MNNSISPNSNFYKYLGNTSWLIAEKILRMSANILIAILMARYLGPEQFGKFNFAFSFVSLFAIISTLGFDKLLTKELLEKPDEVNTTMGSSFLLRFLGALILILLVYIVGIIFRPNDKIFLALSFVMSCCFILNSFEVIRYWFESKVQAKYSSIVDAIVVIVGFFIKIALIVYEAPLIFFALALLFESFLLGFGLLLMNFFKGRPIKNWKISKKNIFSLLGDAFPLVLAGAVFILLTRIDQVMLGIIVDDSSVGIYSAAVRLSEGWMFVPALIATSLFPAMIKLRKNNYDLFLDSLQHLLNLIVFLALIVSILVTVFGKSIVVYLYGVDYLATSSVFIIHIWGMIFNAISIISFRYFLAEGLQIYSFYRALAGLIINILLNLYLIPLYGAIGAAISTVISQIIAAYLLNSISKKTRAMFVMQSKSLLILHSFNSIKFLMSKK